jgi:glycerol-3-phosphate dehydrogenase (NAD(P)+)
MDHQLLYKQERNLREVGTMKIGLLSTGSWAIGIASVLLENGHSIIMWGREADQVEALRTTGENPGYMNGFKLVGDIRYTTQMAEAMRDVDFLVNAIPTQGIRGSIEASGIPAMRENTVIVNVAKGLEIGSLSTIEAIFKELYPNHLYAVLSGPSHAEEVVLKKPTTLVAACRNRVISEAIQDLFMTSYLRVYAHPDVLGVELSGALKNIIAVGAGICDGMGYGDNAIAALITRGIAEIKRLGTQMGAMPQTFDGLAGIGDLIVTCTSQHSRNRRCGKLIGEGKTLQEAKDSIGMAIEGIMTVQAAYVLKDQYAVDMPIVDHLYRVLYGGLDPQEAVRALMLRQKKHEVEGAVSEDMWS